MSSIRWFLMTVAAMSLMACTAETQAPADEAREADEDQTTEPSEAETPGPVEDGVETKGVNPLYRG